MTGVALREDVFKAYIDERFKVGAMQHPGMAIIHSLVAIHQPADIPHCICEWLVH